MKLRPFVTASLCGFTLCGEAASFANDDKNQQNQNQNQNQQNQQNQNRQADQQNDKNQSGGLSGHRSQGQGSDHVLAGCIAIANQEEIAMARMAEEKASSNEVKEFARMMAKDHQSFLQKLKQFSPEATQDGFLNQNNRGTGTQKSATGQRGETQRQGNTDNQRSTNQTNDNQQSDKQSDNQRRDSNVQQATGTARTTNADVQGASATGAQQTGQQLDLLQLHKEIAEQCLNSSRERLSSKSGQDFDECFMHAQVEKHVAMKDKLTVFGRHASPQLAQAITEGLKTTEMHLKKAEEISKNLEGSSSRSKSESKNKSGGSDSNKSE